MMRQIARMFVVIAICTLPACSSITSPSGYDPDKAVDENNRPPGPGPTVQAVFTAGVFAGNCKATPESCDSMPEIQPTTDPTFVVADRDQTYLVKVNSGFTVRLCALHPGVPGREISYQVISSPYYAGSIYNPGDYVSGLFKEEDTSQRGSPATPPPGTTWPAWYRVCWAVFNQVGSSFDTVNGVKNVGRGDISSSEGRQDLIRDSEKSHLYIKLGFRSIS